jgi:hypothetical protein
LVLNFLAGPFSLFGCCPVVCVGFLIFVEF